MGRAVVLGGSIAGSLAAAALSRHFASVLVLDRDDDLPTGPVARRGAAHAHQFHVLTAGGRLAMEELVAGLTDSARADGVPYVDLGADVKYGSKCGWFPRFQSDIRTLMPSRTYLEGLLRRQVSDLDGVEFCARFEVAGLVEWEGWIIGVRTSTPTSDELQVIDADLVVDTTGRGSKAPDWLDALGFDRPEETSINAYWGYTTTYVRPDASWNPDFSALYLGPTVTGPGPSATRGGAIWNQEGGLWVVTAQGCARDYPPSDLDGLREWFSSFEARDISELLQRGEVVAPIKSWRNTANRLRDYVSLARRPEGFIACGDSVAAFNPIYGQGMASAAMGARILAEYLDDSKDPTSARVSSGFAAGFHKRLDTVVQECWSLSTNSDFKVPGVTVNGVEAEVSAPSAQAEYLDRVLALATEDRAVAKKFMEMRNLLRGRDWLADESLQQRVRQDWDRLGSLTRA